MLTATSSQTIGPYWHLIKDETWWDLTRFGATGEIITLEGIIRDGADALVTDACVELWQSTPGADEHFTGFGRAASDAQGRYRFRTLKPAAEPGPGNSLQAPHVALTILARGLLYQLCTRLYFEGAPENDADPILNLVDEARRHTLMARETAPGVWTLDLRLQGAGETVFFEI